MLNTTMMCASVLLLAGTIYFGRPPSEPAPVQGQAAERNATPAAGAMPALDDNRNGGAMRRSERRLML